MNYSGLLKTVLFTAIVLAVYSFGVETGKEQAPMEGTELISAAEARSFFQQYYSSAQPYSSIPKGVTIDINQFNAMKTASSSNSNLSGFVLYYGINQQQRFVSMVVPLDQSGGELTESVYSTDRSTMGFCPMACDRTSVIAGD